MNSLNTKLIESIDPIIMKSYGDEKHIIYDALAKMLFYLDMYKDEQKTVTTNLVDLQKSLKKGKWLTDKNTNEEAFSNDELRAFRDESLVHSPELYKLFQSMDGDLQKLLHLINNVVTASINNLSPSVKNINHENQKYTVAISHALEHLSHNNATIKISHNKNSVFYKLISKTLRFDGNKFSSPESSIKNAIKITSNKF
jgi:ferredoxin-fold anticodon binding domain-containing protein